MGRVRMTGKNGEGDFGTAVAPLRVFPGDAVDAFIEGKRSD